MNNKKAYKILVKGLVQGVGFRPFIYLLAEKFNLTGWVENTNKGVVIKAEGEENILSEFTKAIKTEAPIASNISSINYSEETVESFTDFKIVKSKNTSEEITEICPDIAVCDECLEDMKSQKNRIDYPFINCTNCGPRFTIIKDLPYDREKTTMKEFVMCDDCETEYKDIYDRRFHAQPVACSVCGPEYTLHIEDKTTTDIDKILDTTASLIDGGKIIAIKGLGGYHICCDATNEETVKRLRELKNREGKPLAVMFSDINSLKEYTQVNEKEEEVLTSWRRPIVLLKQKKEIAKSISIGLSSIGSVLPYMPFHHLIFEKLKTKVIVLTSGNISDEPIIISNEKALSELSRISDAIITYNREIYNRTDDSVVFVSNNKERIIRRSRGFVPSPVNLDPDINIDGIIATGPELANCFCIGKGNQALMSQHIGDLKNLETLDFYTESLEQYKKLFRLKPTLVARDMHPDYLSSKYAEETGLPTFEVQHHHAHIAACMAEYGLNEKVIGVAFDGTGLGDDNKIWGSEFMVCDLKDYERITHFDYMKMPGGDKASKQAWRMGLSMLYKAYGREFLDIDIPFVNSIKDKEIDLLLMSIDKNINAPESSGSGRLFDAVAAITNVCPTPKFHAESPMRLEAIIDHNCTDRYEIDIDITKPISFTDIIKEIVNDIKKDVPPSVISAKFHNTIITLIINLSKEIRNEYIINKVVLSGGTFQNRYILEKSEILLSKNNFEVYTPTKFPSNDGGIALGQLVIAAKNR